MNLAGKLDDSWDQLANSLPLTPDSSTYFARPCQVFQYEPSDQSLQDRDV